MIPTTDSTALSAYQPSDDEKTWGLIAHLAPMGSLFLGPLLVLVVKGNESKWVKAQAIESLNFSITMVIGYALCLALVFVLIGFFLIFPLALAAIVLHIVAGVAAFQGRQYRYPFALRLIKD